MRTICKPDDMPNMSSVFKWLAEKPEFSKQYAQAKQECADAMVEDMLEIADDTNGDAARDRLRVDTRKWISSRLKPKKYGDKVSQDHTSSDGSMTPAKIERIIVESPDTDS